jgi:hypothetical protein
MQLRLQFQRNAVADEVSALTAIVCPILEGLLYGLKNSVVESSVGSHDKVTLELLARLYRPGDGDCGICFEYAVHDALNRKDPKVLERVQEALSKHCGITGADTTSILFGVEKASKGLQLIDTAKKLLTDESVVLSGAKGRPAKLKRQLENIADAFFREAPEDCLPSSISGLWKADLFVGSTDSDSWVATTVKINSRRLAGAPGLRIGIVPADEGRKDLIRFDKSNNLIVCPLPYDQAFVELFYQAWEIVSLFISADSRLPREQDLPRTVSRQVARRLDERRAYRVVDVIETLRKLAQPELLQTEQRPAATNGVADILFPEVNTVLAPMPKEV